MSRTNRTTKPLQRVLALLENLRKSGDSWSAWCPAHADHNNSLSVSEGIDGRVLIFCHAGCDTTDIVAALGLELSDLFPRNRTKIPSRGTKHGPHA